MTENSFKIVFAKLDELMVTESDMKEQDYTEEINHQEAEEIDELRRIVLEADETQYTCYTT